MEGCQTLSTDFLWLAESECVYHGHHVNYNGGRCLFVIQNPTTFHVPHLAYTIIATKSTYWTTQLWRCSWTICATSNRSSEDGVGGLGAIQCRGGVIAPPGWTPQLVWLWYISIFSFTPTTSMLSSIDCIKSLLCWSWFDYGNWVECLTILASSKHPKYLHFFRTICGRWECITEGIALHIFCSIRYSLYDCKNTNFLGRTISHEYGKWIGQEFYPKTMLLTRHCYLVFATINEVHKDLANDQYHCLLVCMLSTISCHAHGSCVKAPNFIFESKRELKMKA